jgi:predicted nucleic acid-binding protein
MILTLKKKRENTWNSGIYMAKLFIDSDVIIDLLSKRNDYKEAAVLFRRIENGKDNGYTSALVFANVHYIMTKYIGKEKSLQNLKKLRSLLSILLIDEAVIDEALSSDAPDFEDAIQYSTAYWQGIDFIITRNKKDYRGSKVFTLTPREYLDSR